MSVNPIGNGPPPGADLAKMQAYAAQAETGAKANAKAVSDSVEISDEARKMAEEAQTVAKAAPPEPLPEAPPPEPPPPEPLPEPPKSHPELPHVEDALSNQEA